MARTSDRVSSIAAKWSKVSPDDLLALTATPAMRAVAASELRTMAMSLVRQDEHKGLRGLLKRIRS